MAFSKAKLLRFNDFNSCAPPPGAYNPKYGEQVVGASIPVSERFVEPRSPASSTCSVESKSVCSANSIPSFRTPTVPQRKKVQPSSFDKKVSLFSPKNSEALREKIVECMNKDMTIKELELQIEEMKTIINALKFEQDKNAQEKEDLIKEMEKVRQLHENNLLKLKEQYDSEITLIKSQLSQANIENKNIINEHNVMKSELKAQNLADMNVLKENLRILENRIKENVEEQEIVMKSIEDKLAQSEASCCELQTELFIKSEELMILESQFKIQNETQEELLISHASEIKSLNKLHKTEVQDLEYEMLKIVTEWRKIVENIEQENITNINELLHCKVAEVNAVNEICNKKIMDIKFETNAQIKQAEENYHEKLKLAEIQMEEKRKELEVDWTLKLKRQEEKSDEILKECQSISEYSIIRCELEKTDIANQLKQEKEDVLMENRKMEEIIRNLKSDMSSIIIELNDTSNNLGKEVELRNSDLKYALDLKHSYEVTLNKTHETVNALKNRLLDSDRDVEQLKSEIRNIENNLLRSENKNVRLEQAHEELNLENSSLKFKLEQKVNIVESELLSKVDVLQRIADEKISELNIYVDKKESDLTEALSQLHEQQKLQIHAQVLINQADFELERLQSENDCLKSKLNQLLENSINLTERNSRKMEKELQKQLEMKNEEIQILKKLVQEQNELIDPFREQLEQYEQDYKLLLAHKNEADLEVKEINLKYAGILGHQNKKQKIKYMVDLKKKNLELQESKIVNEAKLHKQSLSIDHLKYEIKMLKNEKTKKRRSRSLIPTENKENVCSPVKSQINTNSLKVDSPLKERN